MLSLLIVLVIAPVEHEQEHDYEHEETMRRRSFRIVANMIEADRYQRTLLLPTLPRSMPCPGRPSQLVAISRLSPKPLPRQARDPELVERAGGFDLARMSRTLLKARRAKDFKRRQEYAESV